MFFRYDLVFIQRFFLKAALIKILRARKTTVIFDFDDAIYLDAPGKHINFDKTKLVLSAADHIIVSSPELYNFCRHEGYSKVSVITTPIDTGRYIPKQNPDNSTVTIGWIGSPYTSKFLEPLANVFAQISNNFKVKYLFVGGGNDFQAWNLPIENVAWSYDSETECIAKMDIGIMPLDHDNYSKGKGGYKLFQYMAGGIPVIASPVGINSEIVDHGRNGFLAGNDEEWIKYLTLLLENNSLRITMGNEGRNDALNKYSRQVCFEKLSEIINREITWKLKNT
ncbi:MAG: glycosyltransferase family 4 protein [Bacteroidales bacterium]|nr:glycosyltransferase family 4 protein [Bacteroidales bacterium]